jgi:TPR repeat protein
MRTFSRLSLGVVLLVASCHEQAPVAEAGAAAAAGPRENDARCLADESGALRHDPAGHTPCEVDDVRCKKRCASGHADSCLALAYAAERANENPPEAWAFFRKACTLGSAIACTNFASRTWSEGGDDAEMECASRIFEKACSVGEPFGCGMQARLLLQRGDSASKEAARRRLEDDCARLRGFPCRVLAKHLEEGDFGSYDPGRISLLLEKACQGGDPDGCRRPSSAAATFR